MGRGGGWWAFPVLGSSSQEGQIRDNKGDSERVVGKAEKGRDIEMNNNVRKHFYNIRDQFLL